MSELKSKFIAFIDILGFKRMVSDVSQGKSSCSKITKILDCFDFDKEQVQAYGPKVCPQSHYVEKDIDFYVTQISDCVIASVETSPAGLINLIEYCSGIILKLLEHNVMCRGYISHGDIYHTDKYLFGPGYQKVYEAERNVFVFKQHSDETGTPFVQLDKSVCDYVDSKGDHCVKKMFSRFVKQDGEMMALFPFQNFAHCFPIIDPVTGDHFNREEELSSNNNWRKIIERLLEPFEEIIEDESDEKAVRKTLQYINALKGQISVCEETDRFIYTFSEIFNN